MDEKTIWAFDLGKRSNGEGSTGDPPVACGDPTNALSLRRNDKFLYKASLPRRAGAKRRLLIQAEFKQNKTARRRVRRLCLRNAFERGVFAWRTASLLIQETVCVI